MVIGQCGRGRPAERCRNRNHLRRQLRRAIPGVHDQHRVSSRHKHPGLRRQQRCPGINPTGFRAEVSGTADSLPPPGTPPSITQGPVSQTNGLGESMMFSVKVYGSRPLTYQWRLNSQPIPNATNPTLTLNLLTTADAGEYDVVVTNPANSTTSPPATLTVVVLSPAQLAYEPPGPSSRRTGLAISEIMYHPKDRDDGRNLEFVEL